MRFWRKKEGTGLGPIETEQMSIVVTQNPPESVVTVTGRVTIDSSTYVRSTLLRLLEERRSAVVLIDMSAVTYLDASGIGTLLEALRLARQVSVKLRLEGLTGQARMLAEITEIGAIFTSAGSEVIFR
jgi:anti-sigma B factor antagonist